MITTKNWTHCVYLNNKSTAQVSMGAELIDNKVQNLFYVSQFDSKHKSEFQQYFFEIDQALEVINKRYQNWNFTDLEVVVKPSSSGCDSCQAH